MPKILSQRDIENFDRDGYLPGFPVLSPDEVARFRDRLESFERKFPDGMKKLKTKSHLLCPWVEEIARHPRILDLYEDLIGPDILCYSMAFRIKEADGRTIAGWHQDTVYLPIEPILVIGALALSECSVTHGCLKIIPGTHKTGDLPHGEAADPDSILALGQYITADIDASNAVDLVLKPGEIGLFNSGVIHGSQVNTGDDRRILLLVEMMPTRARSHRQRETAMLVRGADAHGNHDADRSPKVEYGADEQAAWLAATKKRGKNIFAGSGLPVSETYGGGEA